MTGIPEQYVDEHGGDSRPSAYWELAGEVVEFVEDLDDTALLVVRASALGKCTWELAAMLQGHTPSDYPEAILNAFAAGHENEPKVIARMKSELGFTFDDEAAQVQGELVVGGGRVVRFHPDGVATPPNGPNVPQGPHIVEVKALSGSNFQRACEQGPASLGYGYDWQLSAEMHAMKLPAVWVLLDKDSGNLATRWVSKAPRSLAEIVKRVKEIFDVAIGDDLATSGRPCDRPDQWPCLFQHLRPEPEVDAAPVVPDSHLAEFRRLTGLYLDAKAKADAAAADRDGYRDQIRNLAEDLGTDRMAGADGTRVVISRSVPTLVDRKKLAADGLLDAYSTKGNERVTVRVEGPK